MEYVLQGLTPELPFRFFEEISAIPRPSGEEAQIADYLCAFAQANGLDCYRDALHNVLIKKPATAGREGEPPLLLQAHTDMVAEKNAGVAHDFSRDPIRLVREGNLLRADGTTLGADDGSGVALMLALLSEAPSHPALECLFTVSEEVGLVGAAAFDYSRISARRLFNLDGGCEREIVIGCCGGLRTDVEMPATRSTCSGEGLSLSVTGLCGGHSGEDIDRGRGNALALMARWLAPVAAEMPVRVASVCGGDKDNAIPRECYALILPEQAERAAELLAKGAAELEASCTAPEDAELAFSVQKSAVESAFAPEDTNRILALLSAPGGVLLRRADQTPHTSRNIAAVRAEADTVKLCVSTRSYEQAEIDKWRLEMEERAEALGAAVSHRGAYPGWESPANSALSASWKQALLHVGGEAPEEYVIHAGLECGLISDHLPGLVAISTGPNAYLFHTPSEYMELDSLARFYRAMLYFLEIC